MKRYFLCLVIVSGLYLSLQASDAPVNPEKLKQIRSSNKILQDPRLKLKAAIEKSDSYWLKLESVSPRGSMPVTGFLFKKSGELHLGAGYDKEGNKLIFPKDVAVIKKGISFSYGKGSKALYIVTDPECRYCKKFEKKARGKLEGYTVHVIFFPLSFHKKAPAMIEWILEPKDDKTRKERFEKVMLEGSTAYQALIKDPKKPFVYSAVVKQLVRDAKKAVAELGARGTPSIFDASFKQVSQDEVFSASKGKEMKK